MKTEFTASPDCFVRKCREVIKLLKLSRDFKEDLHPFVRTRYDELWNATMGPPKRYVQFWRNKFLTIDATSLEEMARILHDAAEKLDAMLADGVVLDPEGGTEDDYALLVTTDPEIARKYDMRDESEFFGIDEED